MGSKPVFLEVESSIIENNLRILDHEEDESFNRLFQSDNYPSKLVKPFPGFCIKTKEENTGNKVFVNICQTDAIPAPKDITESELFTIINSEYDDETLNFKIPMSIGEIRSETDGKGEPAKVCDVAIHPNFFKKVEQVPLFKTFLMAVVFEGLKNKYSLCCSEERIFLKNKKAFGTLQMHRVQQRDIEEKMGKTQTKSILIEEMVDNTPEINTKSATETYTNLSGKGRKPEYRLFLKKEDLNTLIGEFKFPDITSGNELILEIGEDRILLTSKIKGYFVDLFIPFYVNQELLSSNFNKNSKILTITMPVIKSY